MKCPNCGGDASPNQVRCSWCHGSLATVACPSCFAAIFTGMKHCPRCGTEVANAEPVKQIAEACPQCQTAMTSVQLGAAHLSECRTCGGIWVSKNSFETLCQDREQQEAVLGRPVAESLPPDLGGQPRRVYVPCPDCKKLMNRMNFAGCSGVVIDWCREHGTWLDHAELPQIIAFIRGGGLRKARNREKEVLLAESRRLRMKELQLAAKEGRLSREASPVSWNNDPDSLVDLLSSMWQSLKD
jgi:Zn-finger nucleic acid-binding protein